MSEILLFYDIEVFRFDSLIVFKNINGSIVASFWYNNDRDVSEFPADEPNGFEGVLPLISGCTLVGYNNYNYDDIILTKMIRGAGADVIYATSNTIIQGGKTYTEIHPAIKSLDCMQQIDVGRPSLKQIEGNVGMSIKESSVPFDIQRPLTDEEKAEVLLYCAHDITATIFTYKAREKSYFEVKKNLLTMLPEEQQEKARRWNTTTISSYLLLGKDKIKQWEHHKIPSAIWRNINGIPADVWDMWEAATNPEASLETVMGKGISKKIRCFERTGERFEVVFGMGGLHGAPKAPGTYHNVLLADVGSMYPSIINILNGLDDATSLYNQMRLDRLAYKKTDKTKADALKLVLNSVYGNYKNQYSSLFNPRASATVCIYGQCALFDLSRMLFDAGYKIINVNTDGVAFVDTGRTAADYETICEMWESKYKGLMLEIDEFSKWVQRDVNNYIALTPDGKLKTKGGDVNKYKEDVHFRNNSLRIVQKALVDKLMFDVSPLVTVTKPEHLQNPYLYQIILKAGGTFKGVVDSQGDYQQKVNRVFAAAEGVPYTKLYKQRIDDGLVNFPDAPERMFLWNDNCNKLNNFEKVVDFDYYLNLIADKLKGWRP